MAESDAKNDKVITFKIPYRLSVCQSLSLSLNWLKFL
jgi:hypothetical protein